VTNLIPLFAASIYWHFPILLILVSLIYSATRHDDWRAILTQAWRNCVYIIFFMGSVFVVLLFFSTVWPKYFG
jgi:cytochrome bd-type quinol oxidase subunit 2